MRIGVVILPEFSWPEARARWKALEDSGFAHGWTYDHLAWRDLADEPWFGTVPTLTAAATATTSLGLGTWVTSPNYRHPVTLAKDLMTLDDISGGRTLAGIGAGGLGWDSKVLGRAELSPRQRVERLDEFVTLVDLLLRQPETSFTGTWFTAERARMNPAGSRARIPLLVAANGPKGMPIAARSDGWITLGEPGEVSSQDDWWAGVGRVAERFSGIVADTGREPGAVRRMLSADAGPVFALSSVGAFTDAAGRARDLGFTDFVVHWPRPSEPYAGDQAVLDRVADLLDAAGHFAG